MTIEEQAQLLNRIPYVEWDRTVRYDDGVEQATVYGWIRRGDGRADFVHVLFYQDGGALVSTSSVEHSLDIAEALGVEGHTDCERVENVYGDLVANAIHL